MIYLRAGLYAEGPTDYYFLCRLLDRLLETLVAPLFPGDYEVADTLGIDAPGGSQGRRAEAIAAAVVEYAEMCELFVIHADGAGDPGLARERSVEPGIAAARAALGERPLVAVPCIPVREIEAWLLADDEPFKALLGRSVTVPLPRDPEKDRDPKVTLRRILGGGGARPGHESVHALFGEKVRFEPLKALPAFQVFERELREAILQVAAIQGQRVRSAG